MGGEVRAARTGLVSREYRNLDPTECLGEIPALLDLEDIQYPRGNFVGLKQAACEVRFVGKVIRRHDLEVVFSCQLRRPRVTAQPPPRLLPGSVDWQSPLSQHCCASANRPSWRSESSFNPVDPRWEAHEARLQPMGCSVPQKVPSRCHEPPRIPGAQQYR